MKTKIFKKGDKVKYIKEPTKADWESIGEIPIPFKINDILEVYGQNMHSGSIYFKEKGFSYPNICFELYQETYKYEVVHTETQEQWDFVLTKIKNTVNNTSKGFISYKEESGLNINSGSQADIPWWKETYKENIKIYSFEEWLDKFGHKSEYLKQNQQLDKFPNEGHCKSLDKDLINYLIETRGTTDCKGSKDRSEGVGWNYTSYWYLRDCSNSNKPKYELEQLSKFFNKKQEQWTPQVGDWIYSNRLGCWDYNECKHPVKIVEIKDDKFRYDLFSNTKTNSFKKGDISKYYGFSGIVRKALPHEIPTQELSKEDLLAEAKRRYPVGTKYWNLNRAGGKSVPSNTIEELPVIGKNWKFEIADTDSIDGTDIIVVRDKEGMTHGWVYAKNTWAEIVEEPKIKSNKTVFDIEGYQQSDWSQVLHSTGKIIFEDGCAVKLVKNNKILPIKVRNGNITELTELPKRTRIKIIKKQLLTI